MEKFIGTYSPQAYALMRIVVSLLFFFHGLQKVFGLFGGINKAGAAAPLFSLFGIAGAIEIICGLLVMLGFLTVYAAFIASGEMAVAYFMAHAPRGLFSPLENEGELAVLYCFVFLYMATQGSGIWSIDAAAAGDSRGPATRRA